MSRVYVTHQKIFHFAAILNFDALNDKCAKKDKKFHCNFLVNLFSISVSPYFQSHKMLCLSFIRVEL